jgi:hypothetical protein
MATGGQYKKQVKDALKEREHKLMLKHRYDTRITNVRQGKEAFTKGDLVSAIRRYTEYLETIAEVNKIPNIYEIKPTYFDKNKDVTEMLMISHLYFELAKVYDATGKFEDDVKKCLEQFVLFTANQPYQVVNSEMCRKHLRKFKFRQHDVFFNSYQQIFVKSRKCYIATHCFGELHPVTQDLRVFKKWLENQPGGLKLIESYYLLSTKWLALIKHHPRLDRYSTSIISRFLSWFSTGPLKRILDL